MTFLPDFLVTLMTEYMAPTRKWTAGLGVVVAGFARTVKRKKDVTFVRPIWRVLTVIVQYISGYVFKGLKI